MKRDPMKERNTVAQWIANVIVVFTLLWIAFLAILFGVFAIHEVLKHW